MQVLFFLKNLEHTFLLALREYSLPSLGEPCPTKSSLLRSLQDQAPAGGLLLRRVHAADWRKENNRK